MQTNDWLSKGSYFDFDGHKVFYIDTGSDLPVLAILHGFPTCSYDFHLVLDRLKKYFRIVIHDHLGFGLSDKPKSFSYTLVDQTNVALSLWSALDIKELHVLGHDYGTSIITELVARENEGEEIPKVHSYILTNGSMLIRMAKLLPIQFALRSRVFGNLVAALSNKWVFKRNMRKIWYDPQLIQTNHIDQLWKLLVHKKGKRVISKISRYSIERELNYDRWIGGLESSENRFHLVWTENDPIAIFAMASRLQHLTKNNNLIPIPNSGHYPMLESPDRWTDAVLKNPFI